MNISIFNKKYWVRRFSKQVVVKGYLVSEHSDMVVNIHVHPASKQEVTDNPEGEREKYDLQGHGTVRLYAADQEIDRKADLLLYHGDWYECRGCTEYETTLLAHFNYDFVKVPLDSGNLIDLADPPTEKP